ncbi:helicase-related protein [Aidingimonas halophila]|uniref:Helicase conserved C-terminal domain-containing protein n=1 Tax=Aidingimonas halophila TaxID=574349 RepID=A0A1H2X9F3_9GAMM|nr:helicase-related protein [Aidingimonas halophila]GHC28364.1 hypothetical protein GCM10008094_20240 [Aidingimonas halophila]SDW89480.1 Helicase conserved C-terminal domain-containing protein [Aidingimonas halophila]
MAENNAGTMAQTALSGDQSRDEVVLDRLKREMLGPDPAGEPLSVKPFVVMQPEELHRNWVVAETGEEILRETPLLRYGTGILYPKDAVEGEVEVGSETYGSEPDSDIETSEEPSEGFENPDDDQEEPGEDQGYDLDLSLSNARLPRSMALSFLGDTATARTFDVTVSGGFYHPFDVGVKDSEKKWWYRQEFSRKLEVPESWRHSNGLRIDCIDRNDPLYGRGIRLALYVYSRPHHDPRQRLVTVALVNESEPGTYQARNECALFQSHFEVELSGEDGEESILPYPEILGKSDDPEVVSNQLLYRKDPVFAVGHGCSVDWNAVTGEGAQRVDCVSSAVIPEYEVPSITPDVTLPSGESLQVSMEACAQISDEPEGDGYWQLRQVVDHYGEWIDEQQNKVDSGRIPDDLQEQGIQNLNDCHEAMKRMQDGFRFLASDDAALKAFSLMNRAMLLQQQHAPEGIRKFTRDDLGCISFDAPFKPSATHGRWRAFQIGFILMSLKSAVNHDDPMHDAVELIWFPTGGGKTEAYLGLAAFLMLYERFCFGDEAAGVQVLMRYTLRLLTAQQLQRGATLMCALESLRKEHNIPGGAFGIGLWVGGSTTPNRGNEAAQALKKLRKDSSAPNPFLFDRCPWCSAQMGPQEKSGGKGNEVFGYHETSDPSTVEFRCSDPQCDFSDHLPIYIVDTDIYRHRPSLVVGTVDKFAMLAWKPEIRNLFGIGESGKRETNPPGLIIQDELHLITGPLGSMVGLYEPLIEELCTDHRSGRNKLPKIVCATATTRRYEAQVRGLYGRSETRLFPPPALDAEDSFFARYHRQENGALSPGRKYVGIHSPGLGSQLSVQRNAFAALVDASNHLRPFDHRDAYRSLLVFYNSIRELGGAKTIVQSDIPERLTSISRRASPLHFSRYINRDEELTSRLTAEQVPMAIHKLQQKLEDISPETIQSALQNVVSGLGDRTVRGNAEWLLEALKSGDIPVESYRILHDVQQDVRGRTGNVPAELQSVMDILKGKGVVDICLASNIIEVGIDIDRLSLMAIVGQPKTTAQYIQVSGRVGRKWSERPGLVVTLYSATRPRDRSHYERFRAYHQRLYSQVEPASVTPWSLPAIERALRAVCVGYIRQTTPSGTRPGEGVAMERLDEFIELLLDKRGSFMSESERSNVSRFLRQSRDLWEKRQPNFANWGNLNRFEDGDAIFPLGSPDSGQLRKYAWPAPTSMRTVDGEVRLGIAWSDPYAEEGDEG